MDESQIYYTQIQTWATPSRTMIEAVHPSVHPFNPPVRPSVLPSVHASVRPSVLPSVRLSVRPSVRITSNQSAVRLVRASVTRPIRWLRHVHNQSVRPSVRITSELDWLVMKRRLMENRWLSSRDNRSSNFLTVGAGVRLRAVLARRALRMLLSMEAGVKYHRWGPEWNIIV